ncbi:MAG: hypothetical protein ACQETH_07195 [Candidatus Rifleibacteriota bacterium]
MVIQKKSADRRLLLLIVLAMASIVFTGCEKGSLGVKGGTAIGLIMDHHENKPLADVLVRASGPHQTLTTLTNGDGTFQFNDLESGAWTMYVEKKDYKLLGETATDTSNIEATTINVNNGETQNVPTIKMSKLNEGFKGTLKGYPIDAVTGRPLRNFTVSLVSPYIYRKSKKFELASDFRDVGFTGIPGGNNFNFTINCNNYEEYKTAEAIGHGVTIGIDSTDLGVIKVDPLKLSISGTLRNLPGYVLDAESQDIVIWAETAGKVVASFTDIAEGANSYKGSIVYKLDGIPASAGSVAVKCKARGYDLFTIDPAVSIANTMPGGVIGGVDADFSNIEPIKRDLRVVVCGTEPDEDSPSSFENGETARVYIQQGGKDIVPYVDVVSSNYRGEAYISGVITGYPINILAINMNRGYHKVLSEAITVQEDGNSAYTIEVSLE